MEVLFPILHQHIHQKNHGPQNLYVVHVCKKDRDPFYIHAQHIDFEDRDFFGGYVDAELEIALPFEADVAYFILFSQEDKFLKKINEIKIK